MKSTYHQLTYEQRCQISALIKRGESQRIIANTIGVNQSTVSREIRRNRGGRGYRFKQAQEKATERRKDATTVSKMTLQMTSVIESRIRMDWSPEQVSGWLLTEKQISVSHETIYRHIWSDKAAGGDLYTHLRRNSKKYLKRGSSKGSRGHIKNRVSIDERPAIVESNTEVGHWEIDTVIGKGHSGALVTIVERKTKKTLAERVNSKTADEVTKATIRLLEPYKGIVKTITADNGKEFSGHEKISKKLDAQVYFAHPYSSWERGLNENTNGLIRQYFPKDTDFKKVPQSAVVEATWRLNRRPRKCLGFKTPNDVLCDYYDAKAA
jgi:IS30 family transposase